MFKDFFSKITGQKKNILIMVVEIVLVLAICAGSIAGVAVMSNRAQQTSSNASSEVSSEGVSSVGEAESQIESDVSSTVSEGLVSDPVQDPVEPDPEPMDPGDGDGDGSNEGDEQINYTTDPNVITGKLKWSEDRFLPNLPTAAKVLDTYAETGLTSEELLMFTSLKGIVNQSQPRIYSTSQQADAERNTWSQHLSLKFNKTNSPYDLIKKYRKELNGIVVWNDTDRMSRHTVNLATTIAGVEKLLIVAPGDAVKISKDYNLPIVYNFSENQEVMKLAKVNHVFGDMWEMYEYQLQKYGNVTTNRVILGLNPYDPASEGGGLYGQVRDYIIAISGMTVWLDPAIENDRVVLDKYFSRMPSGKSTYLGWWPNESEGVFYCSGYGVTVLASDTASNLSYYAGVNETLIKAPQEKQKQYENKIYIAMVESDGDNLQYMLGYLHDMWQQAERGEVPITYTMTPSLADVGTSVWNYYMKTRTSNDYFCDGPSAYGYLYPKAWDEQRFGVDKATSLGSFLKRSDAYMKKTGLRTITVWNSGSGAMNTNIDVDNMELLMAYANNMPSVIGITQQENMDSWNPKNSNTLINNRFLVRPAEKSYCSEMFQLEQGTRSAIEEFYKDNGSHPVFFVNQAVVWSVGNNYKNMINLANYGKLLAGDDIEYVSLDQLFMMQTQYIKDSHGIK